jgi:hypothetical protein
MTGKGALGGVIVTLTLVLAIVYGTCQHTASVKKAKADKKLAANLGNCQNEETGKWDKIPTGFYRGSGGVCVEGTPPPPPPTTYYAPVEALVLEHECVTPSSSFVGWGYKVRTDGDPLRIKYNGCSEWFEQPARGQFQAPGCFTPGEALFASRDEKNPHVKVWVYRKITVQGGR